MADSSDLCSFDHTFDHCHVDLRFIARCFLILLLRSVARSVATPRGSLQLALHRSHVRPLEAARTMNTTATASLFTCVVIMPYST
jgi:hypothetical protein